MTTHYHENARRLRNAVEPVAVGAYFAPEAHAAYAAIGFDPSPKAGQQDGPARSEMTADEEITDAGSYPRRRRRLQRRRRAARRLGADHRHRRRAVRDEGLTMRGSRR